MTSWDIQPAEVGGVLRKAGTAAEGLAKAGDGLQKTLPEAATAAGTITIEGPYCGTAPPSGPVAAALGEFAAARQKELLYIATRAANSLNGAKNAAEEYLKGDVKMAEHTLHTATLEPKIELPKKGSK
ncbi:DUF6507 family protein [Streptomyces sp. NPDC049577]|uniref:DUF6507 family protein n=1 Tax=Streptomyces sp. NPDC049577 TaxID=3155153 RepID=UPI00342F8D67